jgi:hypothetical protein
MAELDPIHVELHHFLVCLAFIPISFVYTHNLAALYADSAF